MTIILPPPADINDCGVLRRIRQTSTDHDGLAAKVQQFVGAATPMVDLVASGPFRQFTLHNRDHAKKLLHLIDYLASRETIEQLSALECLFLVYAAFLHDMGLAVTSMERTRILATTEFQDSIRDWPELFTSIKQARARLSKVEDDGEKAVLETLIYQLYEAALCAFLRPRHAAPERYRQLCDHLKQTTTLPDLFMFRGVSFEDWLLDVCASHNLDPGVLSESLGAYEDRFPRDLVIAQQLVNTQFCAAMLRLADVLDFDRERTPRILFESLGIPSSDLPDSDVSLAEWEKHMAVHAIEVRPDEIVVSAECRHPAIEKSIKDFCSLIERELRDTMAVLNRNTPAVIAKYKVELPLTVRPRIKSVGYTYKDLSLRMNQSAILSLLMGDRLYSHSGVALRELIQNSLDACEARRCLAGTGDYSAQIKVASVVDDVGRRWIEVTDNGIGMDEHVLSEYFLKLGDSYYASSEFRRHFERHRREGQSFHPLSRFGIGILSVFMLADVLEVRTHSAFSPRDDRAARLVRVERLGGLAYFAECDRSDPGTTIRIRLRSELASRYEDFARNAASYLRRLLWRPWFVLRIELGPDNLSFWLPDPRNSFYSVTAHGRAEVMQHGYEPIVLDLARWSETLSGVVIILFGKDCQGNLTTCREGRRIIFHEDTRYAVSPTTLIPNYKGSRLTVNGFTIGSFRTGRLLRFKSGLRLPGVIDVDASACEGVEFDVSRERLTENGEQFLRKEIQATIWRGLVESGIVERLSPETRLMMPDIPSPRELRSERGTPVRRPDALEYLFDCVAKELPADHWPKQMHRIIADKLKISPTQVSKVVAALLASGAVSKPKGAQPINGQIASSQAK